MAQVTWGRWWGLGLLALGLLGCGQGLGPRPSAWVQAGQAKAAAAPVARGPLGRAALVSHLALEQANLSYKKAGLDRGGARKLDPKGSPEVQRVALQVGSALSLAGQKAEAYLAEGQAAELSFLQAWATQKPLVGAEAPKTEDAAGALYWVAQWRLKHAALVEEAYRRGALALPEVEVPPGTGPAPLGEGQSTLSP